jgi:hypothetical protein
VLLVPNTVLIVPPPEVPSVPPLMVAPPRATTAPLPVALMLPLVLVTVLFWIVRVELVRASMVPVLVVGLLVTASPPAPVASTVPAC